MTGWRRRRSDQYTLAVMVWELLAGVAPFDGETGHDVVAQQARRARCRRCAITARTCRSAFDVVLQRAAALDPDDRFAIDGRAPDGWREAVAARPARRTAGTTPRSPGSSRRRPATLDRARRSPVRNPYKGLRAFDEADAA